MRRTAESQSTTLRFCRSAHSVTAVGLREERWSLFVKVSIGLERVRDSQREIVPVERAHETNVAWTRGTRRAIRRIGRGTGGSACSSGAASAAALAWLW